MPYLEASDGLRTLPSRHYDSLKIDDGTLCTSRFVFYLQYRPLVQHSPVLLRDAMRASAVNAAAILDPPFVSLQCIAGGFPPLLFK